jgi:hypothetical protein
MLLISEHKQKEESWNWNFMIPVSLRSRHRKLYQEAQEDVEQEVHMLRIETPLQRGKFPWQLQWICMESSNWLSVLVGRWWCIIKSAGVSLHCFHMGQLCYLCWFREERDEYKEQVQAMTKFLRDYGDWACTERMDGIHIHHGSSWRHPSWPHFLVS